MKPVCAVLGVARSNVIDRLARPADWIDGRALARLDPAADAMIADAVRAEITALPPYGYRRAGALVSRTRSLMGLRPVNHKRMYRVMRLRVCCCRSRPSGGTAAERMMAG